MAAAIWNTVNFQQSFEKVYQGVVGHSPGWKTDLKDLTDETKKMLQVASKSEEMKKAITNSVDKLQGKGFDVKKTREAILSVFKGVNEPKAGLLVLKTPDEIIIALNQEVESLFAARAPQKNMTASMGTGKNYEILRQIGIQQQNDAQKSDRGELVKKMEKTGQISFAPNIIQVSSSEVKLIFSAKVYQAGIEIINTLSLKVEELNQDASATLSFSGLQMKINEARAAMQTAQDIIIDLGNYDDLNTSKLKKTVQLLKENLEKTVDSLSNQMTILIDSDKCTKAMTELADKNDEQADAQFSAAIDQYDQIGKRAIALIKVDNALQNAQNELSQMAEPTNSSNIEKATQAVTSTIIALDHTTKALDAFTEIAAVAPSTKKTNPLLEKLKNAQKQLVAQSKSVVVNPELKEALEKAESAVQAIDNSTKTIEYSEKQKEFLGLVNKTTAAESKLGAEMKRMISTLSQRALPLMRIKEAKLFSEADCFSSVQMMVGYIHLLSDIYIELEKAYDISSQEYALLVLSMSNDGVHALASFVNAELCPDFFRLEAENRRILGDELYKEFYTKLDEIKVKRKKVDPTYIDD